MVPSPLTSVIFKFCRDHCFLLCHTGKSCWFYKQTVPGISFPLTFGCQAREPLFLCSTMSNSSPEATDLFNKYLLRLHYIPSTIPAMNKTEKQILTHMGTNRKHAGNYVKCIVFQLQMMGAMKKTQAAEGVGSEVALS